MTGLETGRGQIKSGATFFLALGLIVVAFHPGDRWTALMWSGACLGIGSVFGFLFGIPRSLAEGGSSGPTARAVAVVETPPPAPAAPPDPDAAVAQQVDDAVGAPPPAAPAVGAPAAPTPAEPPPAGGAPATPPTVADTATLPARTGPSNLEQVSDWITKLLLGGGLTQLNAIPGALSNWGNYVAGGLAANPAQVPQYAVYALALILYFLVLGFLAGFLITKIELSDDLRQA